MLIFCISIAYAGYNPTSERFSLEEGESIEYNGKKMTLINLDYENERVIVCVNGQKTILGEKIKTVNDAILDLRTVTMNKADIRMRVNCPECECDENCDNTPCFDECFSNNECDDGNDLTEDTCSGSPKKCNYKKTKECTIDEHCDDNDDCTIDKCSNLLKKCIHTEKEECKEKIIEEPNKITGAAVLETTTTFAKMINPLLLSLVSGIMIIVLISRYRQP